MTEKRIRYRKERMVHTDTQNSDLLLVVEDCRGRKEPETLSPVASKVGVSLCAAAATRCTQILPFFDEADASVLTKTQRRILSDRMKELLKHEQLPSTGLPRDIRTCSLRWETYARRLEQLEQTMRDAGAEVGADTIRQLSQDGLEYWNYKEYDYNCVSRFLDYPLDQATCVAFGRTDYFVNLTLNHNYWENIGRQLFLADSRVETLLCIPAHRLKQRRITEGDKVLIEPRLAFAGDEPRLVTFTFLRFPPDMPGTPRGQKDHPDELLLSFFLELLVDALLPHQGSKGKVDGTWITQENDKLQEEYDTKKAEGSVTPTSEPLKLDCEEMSLEAFLTYSTTFPMMVRAEHPTIAHFQAFLRMLDSRRIRTDEPLWLAGANTLVGYYDRELLKNPALVTGSAIPVHPDDQFTFQYLVRYKSKPHLEVGIKIRRHLETVARGEVRVGSVLARWQAVFEFTPRSIREAVKAAIYLGTDPEGWGIERGALVTCLGKNKTQLLEVPASAKLKPDTEPSQKQESSKGKGGPGHKSKAATNEQQPVIPEWVTTLQGCIEKSQQKIPRVAPPGHEGPLAEDILNLRIHDIKLSWEWVGGYLLQVRDNWEDFTQRATIPSLCDHTSPDTFSLMSSTVKKNLKVLLKVLEKFESATQVSSDGEAMEEDQELLAACYQAAVDDAWYVVDQSNLHLMAFKKHLAGLVSAYPERNEASLVVSQTEPRMHLTEPNGLLDMGTVSAHRLFRNYLTRPRKMSLLEQHVMGTEGKQKQVWQGKVVASTGFDWAVVPSLQILYVPVDFKLHTFAKLQPLAHEAGHVFMSLLDRINGSPQKDVAKRFHDEVIEPWVEAAREQAEDWVTYDETQERVNVSLGALQRSNLVCQEFLCDVLGALCAGPAFYSSLFPIVFSASRSRVGGSQSRALSAHPQSWIRVRGGVALARAMGWYVPGEENKFSDPWGIFSRMERALERYVKATALENCELPEYYMVRALESVDPRAALPDYLANLLAFAEGCGWDFLFYPYVEDPGDRELIRCAVNALCEKTMARLLFNDEIVLDLPPKIIAAATMLPPYGRPKHPGGRSLQSIYYTSGDPNSCWRSEDCMELPKELRGQRPSEPDLPDLTAGELEQLFKDKKIVHRINKQRLEIHMRYRAPAQPS